MPQLNHRPSGCVRIACWFITVLSSFCHNAAAQLPEIVLWPERVPGPPVATDPAETQVTAADGITRRFQVSKPRMFVYEPPTETKRTGSAVIILPGGGFSRLSDEHEGSDIAHWFAAQGVVAFQLAYRTPTSKQPHPNVGPVMDAQKAVIEVRNRAAQFDVDPQRIALLGFSAGGQTALVAAASAPGFESNTPPDYHRPNLLLLIYPYKVANAAEDSIREDAVIDASMPPTFIAQAADDPASKVNGALLLFSKLTQEKIPAELHVYQNGGHGYGMRPRPRSTVATDWPLRAVDWLSIYNFMQSPAGQK